MTTTTYKRLLCCLDVHWSGTIDGGGMGDSHHCDICGRRTYRELLFIYPRSLDGMPQPRHVPAFVAVQLAVIPLSLLGFVEFVRALWE